METLVDDSSRSPGRSRHRVLAVAVAALVVVLASSCSSPSGSPAGTNSDTLDVGGQTVTVTGPASSTVMVEAADLGALPAPPSGVDLPVGALAVRVQGVPPGSVATVTVRFQQPIGSALKLIGGSWDPFTPDGTTGLTVSSDGLSLTLLLQDGGRGDSDGVADGAIVDPILPTLPASPPIVASPAEVDFGEVLVGSASAPSGVLLTNTGPDPVGFTSLSVGDGFQFASSDCGDGAGPPVLGPGQSCTVSFRFTPAVPGAALALARLTTNAGDTEVALRGTGVVPPPPPQLVLSPLALDLGTVPVGVTSAPSVITVTNEGGGPATFAFTNVFQSLTQLPSGLERGFELTDLTCAAAGALDPGESCQLAVTLTPGLPGPRIATGAVYFVWQANLETLTFDLTGTGVL